MLFRTDLPYLLFDAGGTLVFPDQSFLAQQAQAQGIEVTGEQLFAGHYQLIYTLDAYVRQHGRFPKVWPRGYARALFELLGIGTPAIDVIAHAAEARHRQKNLWTFTFSWVDATLSQLAAQGYRMSVISNSDGRAAEILHDLDLAQYFEHVFDSAVLGVEKPHPAIFEVTLRELSLQPANALYIGDVFYIDVWSANQVGLGGVHLDPLGLYADWPGVHLTDVRQLPAWLTQYHAAPTTFDLLPTRDLPLVI
ncbi:MAG: HAD family hydrolase [Anaerolineae bacterium]